MKSNIVLIGITASGKTSIGRILADLTGHVFIDTDDITAEEGKTIPELFAIGEHIFRQAESRAVEKAAAYKDAVISTGGGVVLNPDNMQLLARNGHIIWIRRPIEDILKGDISGRPLLTDVDKLYELYNQREPLYKQYAEYAVDNITTPEETAEEILRIIGFNVVR